MVLRPPGASRHQPSARRTTTASNIFGDDGPMPESTPTSETSPTRSCTETKSWWTSLWGDSPARKSPTQARRRDLPDRIAAFGRSIYGCWPRYTRSGRLSRMYLPFDLADLCESSRISQRSGIVVSGIAYPVMPLVPLRRGIESGLWPTPTAQDAKTNGNRSTSDDTSRTLSGKVGGRLSPQFVEWLMGYPSGWTDSSNSETPSSPPSQKRSERQS